MYCLPDRPCTRWRLPRDMAMMCHHYPTQWYNITKPCLQRWKKAALFGGALKLRPTTCFRCGQSCRISPRKADHPSRYCCHTTYSSPSLVTSIIPNPLYSSKDTPTLSSHSCNSHESAPQLAKTPKASSPALDLFSPLTCLSSNAPKSCSTCISPSLRFAALPVTCYCMLTHPLIILESRQPLLAFSSHSSDPSPRLFRPNPFIHKLTASSSPWPVPLTL